VAVCLARNASSELLTLESLNASSAEANKAALIAPGLPIAKVATGIPPGIWTIDKRESIPFKLCDSTGYTQYRQRCERGRHARQMRRPTRSRNNDFEAAGFSGFGVVDHQLRRAVSTYHAFFVRYANRSSVCAACSSVVQSDVLPMMIPTSGVAMVGTYQRLRLRCQL